MDCNLTRDAYRLLCLIYKEYLQRLEDGESRSQARSFASVPDTVRDNFSAVRLLDTLTELRDAGYIKKYLRDSFRPEPQGIICMEQRLPNGLSQVLEASAKIASLIGLV